jgi:hypothetical protein
MACMAVLNVCGVVALRGYALSHGTRYELAY